MSLTKTQNTNYKYFTENIDNWLKDLNYKDKYVVIHERKVQQVSADFVKVFEYAVATFPRDEFIIQQIVDENSINNFLSPAI